MFEASRRAESSWPASPSIPCPRRNSIANESSSKRVARLCQAAVSNLTYNSCSSLEADLFPDIEIQFNYSELVYIAGVSDIPSLFCIDDDDGPPSAPMAMTSRTESKCQPNAKALISLASLHRLLIVTKEFCELLGYSVDSEICGRALKMLVGPRTDLSAIASGLQCAAMINVAHRCIGLYNQDGDCMMMEVTFSPYMSDRETLACCLLEVVSIQNLTEQATNIL